MDLEWCEMAIFMYLKLEWISKYCHNISDVVWWMVWGVGGGRIQFPVDLSTESILHGCWIFNGVKSADYLVSV